MTDDKTTTHFGFQTVAEALKEQRGEQLLSNVSPGVHEIES